MLPILLACADPADTGPADTDPADTAVDTAADTDTAEPPPTDVAFRYAVLADPHVTAPAGGAVDRLDRAVAWINAEAEPRDLRFVLVLGDVAWADGLPAVRASLDRLAIPYVPLNGDNEVQLGSEQAYVEAFADHYALLATTFDDWEMGEVQVDNPEIGGPSWFTNVAFTYEGVRFLGLDWCVRVLDPLLGEFGDLHDFPGGTWDFFVEQVGAASVGPTENVVLFSHIPMHALMFDMTEMERVVDVTQPLGRHVWADLAGHYHLDASETIEQAGYDVHVTDATWDDDVTVRLVEVRADATRFAPVTEVVVVPEPGGR
jgi:hypothetical protein